MLFPSSLLWYCNNRLADVAKLKMSSWKKVLLPFRMKVISFILLSWSSSPHSFQTLSKVDLNAKKIVVMIWLAALYISEMMGWIIAWHLCFIIMWSTNSTLVNNWWIAITVLRAPLLYMINIHVNNLTELNLFSYNSIMHLLPLPSSRSFPTFPIPTLFVPCSNSPKTPLLRRWWSFCCLISTCLIITLRQPRGCVVMWLALHPGQKQWPPSFLSTRKSYLWR